MSINYLFISGTYTAARTFFSSHTSSFEDRPILESPYVKVTEDSSCFEIDSIFEKQSGKGNYGIDFHNSSARITNKTLVMTYDETDVLYTHQVRMPVGTIKVHITHLYGYNTLYLVAVRQFQNDNCSGK